MRDHVDLLARIDGAVGGSALGAIQPQWPEFVFALVTVVPEHRRRGAGTGLYEAISGWARERGLDTIQTIVADDDPESLAFAQRRGFVEESREKGVSLDLTRIEPPTVAPPDGVEIVDVGRATSSSHAGCTRSCSKRHPTSRAARHEATEPFEHWLAHDMQSGPGDRPDATFIALAGDEVIGYAKFSLTAAQPTTAHHDLTGVKRAWRGRGVARALKATQIVWAKANGYEELRTRNDERNAPIRHLDKEFGYRPTVGRIYLKGPLA